MNIFTLESREIGTLACQIFITTMLLSLLINVILLGLIIPILEVLGCNKIAIYLNNIANDISECGRVLGIYVFIIIFIVVVSNFNHI